MSALSEFPIHQRWPAAHPDRIQLYSLNTPNGVKASIMLEETRLPYEAHLVDITKEESHTSEFLSLNPNGKIPAIIDPDGPDGRPLALFGRHLKEHPLDGLPAPCRIVRNELAGLVGQIERDRAGLITFYEARELVDFDALANVPGWLERALERPAVQRGLEIPAR